MTQRPIITWGIPLLILAALITATGFLHAHIVSRRQKIETTLPARERLIELGSTVMLGSFRSLAVDYLWLEVDSLKERREFAEIEGVLQLIAKVQPTDINTYTFQAWNLAYNIQFDAPNPVEGWRWVKKGIEFAEYGARRNPNHPYVWYLYWQIGYIFYHRCGTVEDPRGAFYFDQVQKEYGKNSYEMAIFWFQKSLDAALRPGATNVNATMIANLSWSYVELAKLADKDDRPEDAIADIDKAVAIQHQLEELFPTYKAAGDDASARLEDQKKLLVLYAQTRNETDPARRLVNAENLVIEWRLRFLKPNSGAWVETKFEWAVDRLEQLSKQSPMTANRAALILQSRYELARNMSKEDTAKLKSDLDIFLPPAQTIDLPSAALAAKSWARVIAVDAAPENVRSANAAILKYDELVSRLDTDSQQAYLPSLADNWKDFLLYSGQSPALARQRVQNIALRRQSELLAQINEFGTLLYQLSQARDPRTQNLIMNTLSQRTSPLAATYQTTAGLWSALLRKMPEFSDNAAVAETNLRTLAIRYDQMTEITQALLPDTSLPETFANNAGALWRQLHEFKPGDPVYRQKATPPSPSPTGIMTINDDHEY